MDDSPMVSDLMMPSATIVRGDTIHLPIADATVDLIVTSPPYFGLRSYTDNGQHMAEQIGAEATPAEYLDALIACTREWMRVLKPGGSIFVNLGDKYQSTAPNTTNAPHRKYGSSAAQAARFRPDMGVRSKSLVGFPWRYAIRCIDQLDLILRAEIVWAKPNGLPESVTDRVRRSHEQVFHFVKQPCYYAGVDEIREPYTREWGGKPNGGNTYAAMKAPGEKDANLVNAMPNPLGKLPGSVWSIPTAPLRVPVELNVDHFAAYPPEMVRRIVLGWSPVGGAVLDPFGGTGTTALVASVHGRIGISVDLSADYCRLAQWRTTDEKQRTKAGQPPKPKQPKPKRKPPAEVVPLFEPDPALFEVKDHRAC